MPKFNKTWFGAVMVDNRTYKDVLLVGENIIEREKMISGWFDDHSHHTIHDHELKKLLEGNPEAIIVGNGQSSVLEVPEEIFQKIKKKGIELIVLDTPKAIEKYNEISISKKVNALIHTTC